MSTFNRRRLNQQELLSKDDIELILTAIDVAIQCGEGSHFLINHSIERIEFLQNKLRRMNK